MLPNHLTLAAREPAHQNHSPTMTHASTPTLAQIESIHSTTRPRTAQAAALAHLIQSLGPYRSIRVYDVGLDLVSIIAHTGDPPAHPSFPMTQGLTSAAIRERRTVCVNDVRTDPRYLTAFGSTLSEMIIPVLDADDARVLGTLDIES